jgi:CzcA family heavy metal efflux pump
MLAGLIRFSLRHRGAVIALAVALTAYGLWSAARARLDVFPDFVPPQVTIQTEAPGFSPEQVETRVTLPIETELLGLGAMESLRSESIQGLSILTAVFRDGTDVLVSRQLLAEKLAGLSGRLPAGVKAPRMTPLTSSTMDLLKLGLVSDQMSPMELRALADWTLKPKLLAVAGVAKCSVFGGEVRQWQILVQPEALRARGIALSDVVAAARQATGVVAAGFIENANQRILIETEGQALTAEQLGATVILQSTTHGLPVRLRDVATVQAGAEPRYGDALIQGRPGVLLTLSSQPGASTLDVTQDLEAALADLEPGLRKSGITLFPRLHRPASFIESSLTNIRHSLWLGAALVSAVLLLFLGNLRVACISLTAIPLSLVTATLLLERFGITLNTMTLGGLAIAIGEVVDDAIIDAENILRRLRENAASPTPRPAALVVLDASLEVRTAVVFATVVVALVFLPVLTLPGLQGKFFAPLALSYILAILASMAVALTVTPALSLVFLGKTRGTQSESRVQSALKHAYAGMLRMLMHRPLIPALLVAVLAVVAATRLGRLGGDFIPDFREGHFVLQVSAAPGTGLPEMRRLGTQIATALRAHPGIATVEQQIGRAELGEDPWGPHRSEFHVELNPMPPEREGHMKEEIREILAGFPSVQSEVLTFLGDRIGETISGETAPIVINVFGNDLDDLDTQAAAIQRVIAAISGTADVQFKSPPGAPKLTIHLRQDVISSLGFRPVDVMEAIQTACQGTPVAQTAEGSRTTDVVVSLDPSKRSSPEALGELLIRNTQGLQVPLRTLAELRLGSGRHSILHEGGRRRQTVTCAPRNRELSELVEEIRRQVAEKVPLPAGVYVEYGGAAAEQEAASQRLWINTAIAAVGIIILLATAVGQWRHLLLILANVPFALVGGVLAVDLARHWGGGGLSMGSLVGFVTLFGITMRNSIMLVSHYEHLVQIEGQPWGLETAIRGAGERLIPILMTALVTGLGLLPLALGAQTAGREIEGPMAWVILGGLVTSTLLNLVLLPALAFRFGRFHAPSTDAASLP